MSGEEMSGEEGRGREGELRKIATKKNLSRLIINNIYKFSIKKNKFKDSCGVKGVNP